MNLKLGVKPKIALGRKASFPLYPKIGTRIFLSRLLCLLS